MTDIISKIDEIKRMLEDKLQRLRISANQIEIIHGISDISKRLGLFQSGELRFGNRVEPGKGFSGIRIGFPTFSYMSEDWVLATVTLDVIQFGVRSDGSLYFATVPVPMGEISYFSLTGTPVTITAQSTTGANNLVKASAATAIDSDPMEFDNGGADNGRLRYTGVSTRAFHVACTISISPAAANDNFVFAVAKNGTIINSSRIILQAITSSQYRSSAMHVKVSMATNDYLELFVGNLTDVDDCTIHTMNLFAMGM